MRPVVVRMVAAMVGSTLAKLGIALLLAGTLSSVSVGQVPGQPFAVETPHGAKQIRCEAITITLKDDEDNATARIHAYGYLGDDDGRAITFFWNGGPGWATALLHMGFGAPRIADLGGGEGIADNPLTLVDRTDLIYVDPVGTGLSRAIAPSEAGDFFGVYEDAKAAAQFVARVIAARGWHDRPIYLCGESYGGIRVAAMLKPLRKLGIVPAGLIMISPALECRCLMPRRGTSDRQVAWADAVPTLAALAVSSGRRAVGDRRADLDAACELANGALVVAMRGDADLDEPQHDELREAVEFFTDGKEMRDVRGRDRYDARLRHSSSRSGGVRLAFLNKATKQTLKDLFGVETGGKYMPRVNRTGGWRGDQGKSLFRSDIRATNMIATACKDAGGPRVFIAGGWYDLVVQFGVARRLAKEGAFGQCDLEVRDYPAGHMIYVDQEAHEQLVADLRTWFDLRLR